LGHIIEQEMELLESESKLRVFLSFIEGVSLRNNCNQNKGDSDGRLKVWIHTSHQNEGRQLKALNVLYIHSLDRFGLK
jgi:hypothetical protein